MINQIQPVIPPRKKISPLTNASIDLPAPPNLSYSWNFGSILGLILAVQLITGLLLTIHYSSHLDTAFWSVNHIVRDVSFGWLLRNIHANGASIFFILIYFHILRGLTYLSFKKKATWSVGVTIYIVRIAIAFIGYLLPWGQIRFWGATVITNLFSALPYIGPSVVEWLWGGFAVGGATLTRFYTLHFILPFFLAVLTVVHLGYLHETGSRGPLGTQSQIIKIPFHIHYSTKDTLGFALILRILVATASFQPNIFNDPENFTSANPLVTPTHIKPEWYFLWAYAILRSIPNKLGGVVTIFSALLLLYLLPLVKIPQKTTLIKSSSYLQNIIPLTIFLLLTWIGRKPVEDPFIIIGIVTTLIYFLMPAALSLIPSPHKNNLMVAD